MPARIEPCLALLSSKVPTGPQWRFEVKWDGYRLAVHVEAGGVRILTRGGHDWTGYFPAIAEAARAFMPQTLILDGEAVVLDDIGRSDFQMLQAALGGRAPNRRADEAILFAFDLLYFAGHDLTGLGLAERRQILEDLIDGQEGAIRFSETIETDHGEALFRQACRLGLEGIIAKHEARPYRSGRTGDWLKIKCVKRDSFVVVGYEPSEKVRGAIARLLLAARKGDGLVYCGGVGTGFKAEEARSLKRELDAMKTDKPAVAKKGKGLLFVRPELVAEIEYRGWTEDGKLRHPSFKGLRDKADAGEIFELR